MTASLRVSAVGEKAELCRPCVDCGQITGSFCDRDCLARDTVPSETWLDGQITPLCTSCGEKHDETCHFCRGVHWCRPPAWTTVKASAVDRACDEAEDDYDVQGARADRLAQEQRWRAYFELRGWAIPDCMSQWIQSLPKKYRDM